MFIKKIIKDLDFSDYKKGDIYIMLFFVLYPLLFYSYKPIPRVQEVSILGVTLKADYFQDVNILIWMILGKLLPVIAFTIIIIRVKKVWIYSLIIPLSMYFFQLIRILTKEVKDVDEVEFIYVLPFMVIYVYLIFIYNSHKNYNESKKNFKLNQELLNLKNKALNAQMNPHFISNLIMSLQATMNDKNIVKTKESLIKFNRLTNLILRSTKSNLISLEEELNICSLYLDLQMFRFDDFKYSLNVNDIDKKELEFIKVPPMIIQPLVENAFKHGIRGKEEKGNVEIIINIKNDIILCTITDNGKGIRDNTNTFSDQYPGISIPNIKERLSMFGKVMDVKLDKLLYLENKKDTEGNIIGCETHINIPILSI